MSEEIQQPTSFVDSSVDQLMAQTAAPQIEPQKPSSRKRLILLAAGVFLILGAIVGGIFFWNQLEKPKGDRQAATPSPAPSFQATTVPTEEAANGGSGGTPLIGSSQKLIGVATAMRNLEGMLVQINQIDVCSFPSLKVYATVTDEDGKAFTNIKADDFGLSEDGQKIQNFTMSRVVDETIPLSVALVIDHSGSMQGDPMIKAKEAAVDFVNRLKQTDKVSVIQFDTEIELIQTATSDKNVIVDKINSIAPRSDTALHDVVHFSAENLGGCGRKAIVLLTDGRDTASKKFNLQQSINRANEVNVPVFVVGLKSYQFTPEVLRQIAEQTGGQYFEAPTPNDLAEMYRKISGQLEGQYKFGFQSNYSKDGQEHRIRLESHIYGSDTVSEKSYKAL